LDVDPNFDLDVGSPEPCLRPFALAVNRVLPDLLPVQHHSWTSS